jgi:hypothetical protein
MKRLDVRIPLLLIMGIVFFSFPVCGTIQDIPVGGTVFIGEQGLDITGPIGPAPSQIGWWASGASIATTSPDYTYSVSDPTNFFVSPAEFGSHLGTWYALPAKTAAFNVMDPQISVRVEDTTVSVDVTDKWVPTDDEIRFRIDTNLIPISQRVGVSSVPITIRVQAPDGGLYTSLLDNAGSPTSIENIPVTTTPFYTDSIWGTGQRATYSPGTYTIWAECKVNSMKDNYDVTGKTSSQRVSLLNQDHNPLIKANYLPSTTVPATTEAIPIVKTSVPSTTPVPVLKTPSPVTTSEISPTPMITAVPATITQKPTPTKSPGFEGFLPGTAALLAFIAYGIKN